MYVCIVTTDSHKQAGLQRINTNTRANANTCRYMCSGAKEYGTMKLMKYEVKSGACFGAQQHEMSATVLPMAVLLSHITARLAANIYIRLKRDTYAWNAWQIKGNKAQKQKI